MFIQKNKLDWEIDETSFLLIYRAEIRSLEGLYMFKITGFNHRTFDLKICACDFSPILFSFSALEEAKEAAEKFIQISESNGILFKA